MTLVAADYSQIELRVIAHVSGDEDLRDAFARGADIHRETAARVLRKAPEDVTHDERSMAKMVNFGLAYGMSDYGLSTRAGISRDEARAFIENYFATYSGISYYMIHVKELARRQGWVSTLLGRRRSIPELQMSNSVAACAPGSGWRSTCPSRAPRPTSSRSPWSGCPGRLREAGAAARGCCCRSTTSWCWRFRATRWSATAAILRETMEGALKLDVPLTVDVKVGDDWESMRPLTSHDAVLAELGEAPPEAGARMPDAPGPAVTGRRRPPASDRIRRRRLGRRLQLAAQGRHGVRRDGDGLDHDHQPAGPCGSRSRSPPGGPAGAASGPAAGRP